MGFLPSTVFLEMGAGNVWIPIGDKKILLKNCSCWRLVVRCDLVVGDLLCSSTNNKLAVWVGDLGWDMGCRSKRLASVLESPKKHTFIGKTTS